MPAAVGGVAGGRAHDHEAGTFEIGDQPFGHQTGHQLGSIMCAPASVVTERVHQDFGDVRGAGRDQIIAGGHQNTP
ncbi:hypothetical protein [Gluconobacter japonicus]|uniref:Uncharacterized protein n=1 Tax=Gluconobacter japonicus TaxID=376620 RepID=A0A9Q2FP96_GLUJA|nr:hypothetical protein [Gluconobacter japonicus]MBF0871871.1 hypothetical protein [Gluconobacter japonicus]